MRTPSMSLPALAAVTAILVAVGSPVAFAAGDSCADAISISDGVTAGSLGPKGDKWYGFVGDVDNFIIFHTHSAATEFTARLEIYGGCGGELLGDSDGVSGGRNARVGVDILAGASVAIRVSKLAGLGTAFELSVGPEEGPQCPGVGDCFSSNGSPACDDTCSAQPCPGCCATVCGVDPFCCTNTWDVLCANQALSLCIVIPVELQSFGVE